MKIDRMLDRMLTGLVLAAGALLFVAALGAQGPPADKKQEVVVGMMDGMRWQEVFQGADPTPQMVRQMVNGQLSFPTDPDRKLMLTKLMERYEQRQAQGGDAAAAPNMANGKGLSGLVSAQQLRSLRQGTAQQRLAAFQALPRETQDEAIGAMPRSEE